MKAARFHAYGGPEALVIDDLPIPEPGLGEVQIKVAGAGIIPFDWKLMKGFFKKGLQVEFPAIFGHEVSGTVTKLGPDVGRLQVGDTIYGQTRKGAAAEYTTIAENACAPAPTSLDLQDAAAVPVGGMTAWQALFDHGGLESGQRVLIHGGAGGVGMFAIQLAKWKGAYVITTASAANEHFVRELGADEVVDYSVTAFESVVKGVELVLDTIGGDTQKRSLGVLKPGGILVSLVGLVDPGAFERAGMRTAAFSMQPSTSELDQLRGLIEDMTLSVVITVELPLARIREAVEESASGHARGKIVVRVS